MKGSASWPDGLSEEVAVLDIAIADLENLYGLEFTRGLDDLDYFQFHVFQFGDRFYGLMRYENAPLPGVMLVIKKQGESDMNECVDEALRKLNLTDIPVVWQRS